MPIKETLDAIDLIAARLRIWAQSLLTLFGGALLVDAFGGFNDLVPEGSRWHKVLALVTVLVARYTHSKQSAEAVIDAKADRRTTPVTPMGALPAVVLLLLASMAFAACGGPAQSEADVVVTESSLTRVATGGQQCWQGLYVRYVQPIGVSYYTQPYAPGRWELGVHRDQTVGTSSVTLETMNCDTDFRLWQWGSPTCNASNGACNSETWSYCDIYRKDIGQTTYHLQRIGWVDLRMANFVPASSTNTSGAGSYDLVMYSGGGTTCSPTFNGQSHYNFH